MWLALSPNRPRDTVTCPGAYRKPWGNDAITFYGCGAANPQQRPALVVSASTADPLYTQARAPEPPPAPVSRPGTVLLSTPTSVTITCDGGNESARRWTGLPRLPLS
jgi:hypothetical protein